MRKICHQRWKWLGPYRIKIWRSWLLALLLWRHIISNPIRSNFQLFFWQSDLFEFFAPGRTRTRDHFSPGWSKTLNGTKNFGTTRSNARNHNTILCCTHIDFRRRGSSGRLFGWWLYVLCCKNGLVYPPPTVDQTIIEKIEKLLYFKGLWTKWFF